jgi:hypothetical protein
MGMPTVITVLNVAAVCILLLLLWVAYRFIRDVIAWRRIVSAEIERLAIEKERCNPRLKAALGEIESRCRKRLRTAFVGPPVALELEDYLSAIAGHLASETEHPLYNTTLSRILKAVDTSLKRLEQILYRPGFDRLSDQTLYEIRRLVEIYLSLTRESTSDLLTLQSFRFLVKRLNILFLLNYLAVDLFLYIGRLAVDIYGDGSAGAIDDPEDDISDTLGEISRLEPFNHADIPVSVEDIRDSLVGMPGVLWNDPDIPRWKEALMKSSERIAAHYFPGSEHPLEEARIGRMVQRMHAFLSSVSRETDYSLTGKIANIRLETLFKAQSLSQAILPQKIRSVLVKTQMTHGWLKWPLTVYMTLSKGILWKMAGDAGWFAGRKALLVVIFGRSFDKAVQEVNAVYSLSSGNKGESR